MAVNDVSVRFAGCGHRFGRRVLFRDLTAELSAGEIVGVTGANGTGKSTLLKLIAGLLRPTVGSVNLLRDGHVLTAEERRAAVGYAGVETMPYEALTVRENLRFFAEVRGLDGLGEPELVGRLGLEARLDQLVAELSSGYRQRVRLALALLHQPAVLLLDEPTVTLDEAGGEQVAALLQMQQARGLCVVATNDSRDLAHASRILKLGA